jgi:hypothetical protein
VLYFFSMIQDLKVKSFKNVIDFLKERTYISLSILFGRLASPLQHEKLGLNTVWCKMELILMFHIYYNTNQNSSRDILLEKCDFCKKKLSSVLKKNNESQKIPLWGGFFRWFFLVLLGGLLLPTLKGTPCHRPAFHSIAVELESISLNWK